MMFSSRAGYHPESSNRETDILSENTPQWFWTFFKQIISPADLFRIIQLVIHYL
jgi:hypothetical protein